MKKFLISVLILALGFGGGYWYGVTRQPPSPQLRYVSSTSRILSTYVWVKNDTDGNIYLDGATLRVTSTGHFSPKEPEPYGWDEKSILLRGCDNPHKNGEDLKFFTKDGMTIFPSEIAKIRVRIQNEDFPGINVIGNLSLNYFNDAGGKGTLDIRGLSIDIESW